MADTTFMADSYLTKRERTRRADGGIANTHKPNSLAATLRGEELGIDGLFYSLGYAYQAKGKPKGLTPTADIHHDEDEDHDEEHHDESREGTAERRYSVGLGWEGRLNDDWELYSINEAVLVDNLDGKRGFNRLYLTLSQRFTYDEKWHWQALYAGKLNNADYSYEPEEDENEYMIEASMGYALTENIEASWGYGWQKEEGTHAPRVAFLLQYVLNWGGGEHDH